MNTAEIQAAADKLKADFDAGMAALQAQLKSGPDYESWKGRVVVVWNGDEEPGKYDAPMLAIFHHKNNDGFVTTAGLTWRHARLATPADLGFTLRDFYQPDWSRISEGFDHVTVDADGSTLQRECEPHQVTFGWKSDKTSCSVINAIPNWRELHFIRPGKE